MLARLLCLAALTAVAGTVTVAAPAAALAALFVAATAVVDGYGASRKTAGAGK